MCTTRILSRSTMGFINQCIDCRAIHLAFGTVVFRMSEEEFASFCSCVDDEAEQINDRINPATKSVQIGHPSQLGCSLVLSVSELLQLQEMIQKAHFLLTAYNLIRDDETLY